MKLAEKLAKLLKQNQITVAELSRLANVPDSTIRSIFANGGENTKLSTLRKLAQCLNVSLDYLADNNKTEPAQHVIVRQYSSRLYTLEELNELDNYAQYLLKKRGKQ